MQTTLSYLMLALWLCAACQSGTSSDTTSQSSPKPPNIIYLMADDLGIGDLGSYGAKAIQTPRIDQMAAEGMRFTQHYAGTPVCAPSRAVLMTGRHTGHAYVRGNMQAMYVEGEGYHEWGQLPLPDSSRTVAEYLQAAGYATGMIGKWGLGEMATSGNPMQQGFDYFFGYTDQVLAHNAYPEFLWENDRQLPLDNVVHYLDSSEWHRGLGSYSTEKNTFSQDLFLDRSLGFIREHADEPFFLYLPYIIPHDNGEAPRGQRFEVDELGEYADRDWPEDAKNYAAMVTRLDRDMGAILDLLQELGLAENTLVVFTSDNGPTKDSVVSATFDSNGSYRGFKRDVYEGGIRMPMIAWWPGTIAAGSTTDHASAFWDFLPTACDLAGVDVPEGIDGISYAPTLRDQAQPEHKYLYWEFSSWATPHQQALIQGEWKAICFYAKADSSLRGELYHLGNDPSETTNLIEQEPERFAAMLQIMQAASEPHPSGLFTNYDALARQQ